MDERTCLTAPPADSANCDASPHERKKCGAENVISSRYTTYGTTFHRKQAPRSTSVPVRSTQLVFVRRHPTKYLTIGQQSAKLAEQAKRNFFHGSFTSSHGAVFTVPNRAQQLATALPPSGATHRHHSPVRGASSSLYPAVNLESLFGYPSVLKKQTDTLPVPPERWHLGGIFEPIVLRRRAASADGRMNPEGLSRTHLPPSKNSFRESSPDLLALQVMREHSATQERRPVLSPITIAKAAKALRSFEEKKVRLPLGSFAEKSVVDIDGHRVPVPELSPIVLANADAYTRRVPIRPDLDQGEVFYPESEAYDKMDYISWTTALIDILYLAAPAAVSMGFTFSMSVVPLAFIGSILGERELTGASVGYFIMCIVIVYPMVGLTFAIDTLCSHEYGRDPISPEMGLVLQRGVFINIIFLTPLCVMIYYLETMLVRIYGANITDVAVEFLTFSPLYVFPIMLFIAINKFLNNQMQPHLPMIALTAGVILMPFLQLKLTPMGVRYTMIGMSITAWFQLCVVVVLTLFNPVTRMTLGTWRVREALYWADVKEYMKLAIPSAIFVAAEASSFDITVLLCAKFSEADGAAWSAIMNSLFIFASLSGGLSTSACANIGRCVGADDPFCAKRFVLLSIFLAFIVGVVDSTILVVFYDFLMSLFGTKLDTLALAREVLFMLPFFHIADSVQFTFQGIFSGLGKNYLGAVILLSCLWCIGIPLSVIFGQYLGYNMFGVCVGITVGLCIEAPLMVITASTMDYQQICDKFMDDEEEEEIEKAEAYDEEYVEEVMRRSGISTASNEFGQEFAEQYKRLRPPQRRRHQRRLLYIDDDEA